MALLDFFRPRWRHSDPTVRAEAVRSMGPHDLERLAAIAGTDPDARVRRAAIKRLDDPSLLDRLAGQEADPTVRETAAEHARDTRLRIAKAAGPLAECEAALAGLRDEPSLAAVARVAAHTSVRNAALARITSDRALRDLVKSAASPEIRHAALDRIQDPATLRSVALAEGAPELALAAVQRITDVGALTEIASNRRAAKAVRRYARERLPSDAEDRLALDVKRARVRQRELGSLMLTLQAMTDVAHAGERAREAEREWLELAQIVAPPQDVAERFTATCRALLEAGERRRQGSEDAERASETISHGLETRRQLCARVGAPLDSDVAAVLEQAETQWRSLEPLANADAARLERQFREACAKARAEHDAGRARAARLATITAIVEEAEAFAGSERQTNVKQWQATLRRWEAATQGRNAGNHGSDGSDGDGQSQLASLEQRFSQACERQRRWKEQADQRRAEHAAKNLRQLGALAERIEAMLAADELVLRAARTELQAVDNALQDLGPLPPGEALPQWKSRLGDARTQLRRRVTDLEQVEGWRRWANADAQEELIRRAEALLTSEDLADVTRQLGQLRADWAQSATVSPDRAQVLWERFRTVTGQLRERSEAYLAANLEKKRTLCLQVAEVSESSDWNDTAALIKRLQAEWKEIGPVPSRQAQELWQQFREPCDRFFTRRKEALARLDEERLANAARKNELCEKAESLLSSTDWDTTADEFKQLQAEWKQTGPPPRDRAEALWGRFRAACDQFFDRRSRRAELEREQALEQVEALCQQLEELAASASGDGDPSPDGVREQLDDAWGAWIRIELDPDKASASIKDRIYSACVRIAAARPESIPGSRLDPAATLKRREKLCERAEALLGPTDATPAEASLRDRVLALREQLATNTITGTASKQPDRQGLLEDARRFQASWGLLGPPLDETARLLEDRFQAAVTRLQEGSETRMEATSD